MQSQNKKQLQRNNSIFFKETHLKLDIGIYAIVRPLSYKQLQTILSLLQDNQTSYAKLLTIKYCTVSIFNIFLDREIELDDLSHDIKDKLYLEIEKISLIEAGDLEHLATAIDISLDKQFQTDTWKCEKCKLKRGLQKRRACPYIPEEDRDKNFNIYVKGTKYTQCPIYHKVESEYDLENAMKIFELINRRTLPAEGGWYDQTAYAVLIGDIIKSKFDEAKQKAQEEAYKKTK